jgi:hypothetical protein
MKRRAGSPIESIHRLQPCAMINNLSGETTDGPSLPVPPEPTKPAKLTACCPAIQRQTNNITWSFATVTIPTMMASLLLQGAGQSACDRLCPTPNHALPGLQTIAHRPHRTTLELLHKPFDRPRRWLGGESCVSADCSEKAGRDRETARPSH